MIRHIIRLLWNKRKNNAMMVLEIMLSFFVLFAVLTFVISNYVRYKSPMGFDTEDIYSVHFSYDYNNDMDSIQLLETHKILKEELLRNENITDVALNNGVIPFSGSQWTTTNDDNGFEIETQISMTDHDYFKTMGIKILEGRSFLPEDLNNKYPPIMVSKNFKEAYYPDQPLLDSILLLDGEHKVCGIFEHYKYMGEFSDEGNMIFYYLPEGDENIRNIMFRVKPGTKATFEEEVNNTIAGILKSNDFIIENLDNERKQSSARIWIPIVALLSIATFLCINVALGLFGALWQNITKRRAEIGLRRALGAHTTNISLQITAEIMTLTVIGILIGLFFAMQFPLLKVFDIENSNYIYAMLSSGGIILLLVLLCALYPSSLAAKIHPAVALHEE